VSQRFYFLRDCSNTYSVIHCYACSGNGYPVAAVVCRREVAESFAASGIEYFNTYGGNSVACAVAEAVLDTIFDEKLQENAREVGEYLTARLLPLKEKYDWVGDVRGVGLFQGVEFVKTKNTDDLQPHPDLTKFLVDYLRYQRVIVSRDGPDGNVIKVKPPLVFSKENVDTLVDGLDQALAAAVKLGIF
jgi:ethanolamine-phosphate phospho-lyase